MPAEFVLDASVGAKCFFEEEGSVAALEAVGSGALLIAPDFICVELASIAAKKVRRGEVPREVGEAAVASIEHLVHEVVANGVLAPRAFALAVDVGCSAYDGLYLSLAEARGCRVLTADERLLRRASEAGLGYLVEQLQP
jgi:predicted nucleic acid-binding protein